MEKLPYQFYAGVLALHALTLTESIALDLARTTSWLEVAQFVALVSAPFSMVMVYKTATSGVTGFFKVLSIAVALSAVAQFVALGGHVLGCAGAVAAGLAVGGSVILTATIKN